MYVDNFLFSFPIPDFFLFLFNCNDGFQSWKAQNNILEHPMSNTEKLATDSKCKKQNGW